ncbi:MAG: hypothetical protein WBA17_16100 [Saprospiraceae bacterium]
MTRLLNLLLVTVIAVSTCCGQVNNYHPAYYINLAGDTVNGMINRDNDLLLSKRILFNKNLKSNDVIELSPERTQSFQFTDSGLRFVSIPHSYTITFTEFQVSEQRFAQQLVSGYYNLYTLDRTEKEFFKALTDVSSYTYYLEHEGEFVELARREEMMSESTFRIVGQFKGTLKYLLRDWELAPAIIDKMEYREEELISLIFDYNSRIAPATARTEKTRLSSRLRSVEAGVFGTRYLRKNSLFDSEYGLGATIYFSRFANSNSISVGLGIEYIRGDFIEDRTSLTGGGRITTTTFIPVEQFRLILNSRFYLTRQEQQVKPFVSFALIPEIYVPREFKGSGFMNLKVGFGGGLTYNRFTINGRLEGSISNSDLEPNVFRTLGVGFVEEKKIGLVAILGLNYRLFNF